MAPQATTDNPTLDRMKTALHKVVDSIDWEEVGRILSSPIEEESESKPNERDLPRILDPISIETTPTFNGYDWEGCARCGKDVGSNAVQFALSPQDYAAHDPGLLGEQEGDDLELGVAYLGSECAKHLPSEYHLKAAIA